MSQGSNIVFLIGSARSGTSWLGKILDSHQDVLYRMEPDTLIRADYPYTSDDLFVEEAREHLDALCALRKVKVSGSRPVFEKAYLSAPAHLLKRAFVYGAKGLERALPAAGNLSIPDLTDYKKRILVMKTVSALGRAASWQAAYPEAKFVHVIRHPCGHVASVLNGQKNNRLPENLPLGFENCKVAHRYGLTTEKLKAMSEAERVAWCWVVQNETALETLSNAYVITYEEFCTDPMAQTERMFAFLDFAFEDQTKQFLIESTSGDGGYFDVQRDPAVSANRWRQNFDEADDVLSQIGHTDIMKYFND